MELPKRKSNRLKYHDYSAPGAYFITICTEGRKEILSSVVGDGDIAALDVPKTILTDIGKIAEKHIISIGNAYPNISIIDYIIMPNHIHMVIVISERCGMSGTPSPTNAKIPHIVSTLKRFCTKEIGYDIFQRSFHDHIIRNRRSLTKIREYIQNNPKTWENDCFYDSD